MYDHDLANRLLEDDASCYGYDANGNLFTKTEKVAGSCVGGPTTTYVWDVRKRLVRVEFPDLTSVDFRYDGIGRRIETDTNGEPIRYVYDGDDILLEFNQANQLTARYSHGLRLDQHLALERNGQSFYYQTDKLGSVRLVTDADGTIVSSYDYDSFGNLEPTTVVGLASPYAFTGRELDSESGLYYYRARYYAPFAGRFISEDPIGFRSNDLNFYRYVLNTPINTVDPDGTQLVVAATQRQESFIRGAQVGGFVGSLINRIFNYVQVNLNYAETQIPGSTQQEFLFAITRKAPLDKDFTKDIGKNAEKALSGADVEPGDVYPSLDIIIVSLTREELIALFDSRIRPGTGFDLLIDFLKEEEDEPALPVNRACSFFCRRFSCALYRCLASRHE